MLRLELWQKFIRGPNSVSGCDLDMQGLYRNHQIQLLGELQTTDGRPPHKHEGKDKGVAEGLQPLAPSFHELIPS